MSPPGLAGAGHHDNRPGPGRSLQPGFYVTQYPHVHKYAIQSHISRHLSPAAPTHGFLPWTGIFATRPNLGARPPGQPSPAFSRRVHRSLTQGRHMVLARMQPAAQQERGNPYAGQRALLTTIDAFLNSATGRAISCIDSPSGTSKDKRSPVARVYPAGSSWILTVFRLAVRASQTTARESELLLLGSFFAWALMFESQINRLISSNVIAVRTLQQRRPSRNRARRIGFGIALGYAH
jgi:hypothetical protein